MSFTFDARLGRYRDADSGRLVSEAAVRLAIDAVADAASDHLADLTERMLRGDLKLADWQRSVMATIKTAHVAAGVAAQGGKAQMEPTHYGFLGSEIRRQYAYLRDLANGIAAGDIPLDGRLVARAGMYGQHVRVTYEAVRAKDARSRDYIEERNVLHSQESCRECSGLSSQGYVPLGTLPPIGSRSCLSRCRCQIQRRRASQPRAVEAVA